MGECEFKCVMKLLCVSVNYKYILMMFKFNHIQGETCPIAAMFDSL